MPNVLSCETSPRIINLESNEFKLPCNSEGTRVLQSLPFGTPISNIPNAPWPLALGSNVNWHRARKTIAQTHVQDCDILQVSSTIHNGIIGYNWCNSVASIGFLHCLTHYKLIFLFAYLPCPSWRSQRSRRSTR